MRPTPVGLGHGAGVDGIWVGLLSGALSGREASKGDSAEGDDGVHVGGWCGYWCWG